MHNVATGLVLGSTVVAAIIKLPCYAVSVAPPKGRDDLYLLSDVIIRSKVASDQGCGLGLDVSVSRRTICTVSSVCNRVSHYSDIFSMLLCGVSDCIYCI